ncbi:hypothetical protein GGS20DRAFT_391262 [Poronia punctata]|nr:hypothetical protein GGS20DRAFT_391262 [Poronia punctata]
MAQNVPQDGVWTDPTVDDRGPQIRPMGLKVHYTFDKDNQERCLARWPHILNVQTIPMEGQTIGLVNLGICLHAVANCSPELAGDGSKDYAVYAFDYSEPDTPLVGQGLLSRGLNQQFDPQEQQLITGRVSKNLLGIFGHGGTRETLEVRLKLTAITNMPRNDYVPRPQSAASLPPPPNLATSSSMSENGEWGSLMQSQRGHGHSQPVAPANPPTFAPAPMQPYPSHMEAKAVSQHHYPPLQPAPTRPGSIDLSNNGREGPSFDPISMANTTRQSPSGEETTATQPAPRPVKPQTRSRPNSRASSRPPTGRPRGRPRKRPLASEGNTSGCEEVTDGDDASSRAKKRATITQVERNNKATFGSAPESLRVAASTSGSIRNFRPVAPNGKEGSSHLQPDGPRAPTPIPGSRFQAHPSRLTAESSLRRQSTPIQPADDHCITTAPDLARSMSHEARSPVDSISIAPSPFSDEASPATISSSPPVPRSAMYSMRSSPAPSSPILPPMRVPTQEPDSGFMSGGLDDVRTEDDITPKPLTANTAPAPVVAKPKPRRSRLTKVQKVSDSLHIHTEVPGPPELLPQTSIYNPPRGQGSRKKSSTATPVGTRTPAEGSAVLPEVDYAAIEAALNGYSGDDQFLDTVNVDNDSFGPHATTHGVNDMATGALDKASTEPPVVPTPVFERSIEREQEPATVPASDPVLPQSIRETSMSFGQHPQTDAPEGTETRMNKNYVKRQAIKQKLEEAVALGQMPSWCRNCGALETPTWRKIWKKECRGAPELLAREEYSIEPGCITAHQVLERDDSGAATLYHVLKKSLGPQDDKSLWTEVLLCNPCGIWFTKCKEHRPPNRWEKDEQRLSQTRKKRAAGHGGARPRKGRAKSDAQKLTSEAFLPTDPAGPADLPHSPKETARAGSQQAENMTNEPDSERTIKQATNPKDVGSTHSRASHASGTAMSPIDLDEELGATRRLLFPSPRKNQEAKILGEVAVNKVQIPPKPVEIKDREGETKGKSKPARATTPEPLYDDMSDLFGTPPRPSTPPPKTNSNGPFKTPTRPTPSHRPVTRSVSKSMRSSRSSASLGQRLLERTPTRTPRKTPLSGYSMSMPRRSPRHQFPSEAMGEDGLTTPLTHSIGHMFTSLRGFDIDYSSFPNLDNIDQDGVSDFDFSAILPTDPEMPSPPPIQDEELLIFGRGFQYELAAEQLQLQPSPTGKGSAKQGTIMNNSAS